MSINVQDTDLKLIIDQVEKNFDIHFSYSDKYISNEKITIKFYDKTLSEIIELLNEKSNLNFEQVSSKNIIIQKIDPKNVSEFAKTQILNEIVLNEYLTKGIRKQKDGSYNFSPKEIEILPGLTDPDVFQSLQLIPGVISPDETSANIFVRGGSPDQNLIIWDGVKIYLTGHLFGTFSAFNSNIIKKITFINKGTNAKYGERISSVINIKTNDEISDKFHGGFGINLIDTDAYMDIPVIKNKLSFEVSARRSYTDLFSTNAYKKYSDKVFQNQDTGTILKGKNDFFYLDYNLKVNYKLDENNYFNLSLINIENDLKSKIDFEDEEDVNDQLETMNIGSNLNWIKNWSAKWHSQSNVYFSKYSLNFLHKEEIKVDNSIAINNTNKVQDIGLNFNLEYQIAENKNLQFGYQFSRYNIEYELSSIDANDELLSNKSTLNSYSLYSSYVYKNEDLFNFTGGLRYTFYSSINNFVLEPRFNIFKKISQSLSIQGTIEKKTQAVSQINRTINKDLSLENQIWSIANNNQVPLATSWQYTTGFSYSKNNWDIELDTYFKKIEGITTLNNGFIDIKDFKINTGESKIIGADSYIKKRINQFASSISYTLSSSKNNFEELNENQSFPSNTDITHNINWLNEYTFRNFNFALGWRLHSGKPYSKAIGIKEDEFGVNHLIYDGINAYRLPSYSRFDFSSTYKFNIFKNKNIKGKIGVSVLNFLNNKNILNRTFSIDKTNEKINTIDTRSIERVTNIVFRLSW